MVFGDDVFASTPSLRLVEQQIEPRVDIDGHVNRIVHDPARVVCQSDGLLPQQIGWNSLNVGAGGAQKTRRGIESRAVNSRHVGRQVSGQPLRTLALSPDAREVAVAGDEGRISVWSTLPLSELRAWNAGAPVLCLGWNPEAGLAAGLASGEVAIWNPADGSETRRWPAHEGAVTALDWHPQKPELTTGGADGVLAWWSAEGKALRTSKKNGAVRALAWRPDGSELAVLVGNPAGSHRHRA